MHWLVLGLAAALLSIRPSLSAQEITKDANGTISVRASDIPLGRLLRALAEVTPVQDLKLDPSIEGRPVTVAVDSVNLRRVLTAILGNAGVDFVLASDETDKFVRLVAGDRRFIASSQRPANDQPSVSIAAGRVMDRVVLGQVGSAPAASPVVTDVPAHSVVASNEISAGVSNAASGEAPDPFTAVVRNQELERALSESTLKIAAGGIVELPFPTESGAPLFAVKPPKGAIGPALPLPIAVAQPVPAAQSPRPAGLVTADPRLQGLIDALSPKPGK